MIRKSIALASTLLALGLPVASAAVTFTDVTFTETLLSFTVSGTLDGPLPTSLRRSIMIVATDPSDNDWITSSSTSFISGATTNTFAVNGSPITIASISTINGSRTIYFQTSGSSFAVGNAVTGTFTATLPGGLFDFSKLDSELMVVWGTNNSSAQQGAYLDTIEATVIPEPQTYAAVLGLATLGFVASRRTRRAKTV